jgi:hypothetical protein
VRREEASWEAVKSKSSRICEAMKSLTTVLFLGAVRMRTK